MRLLINIILIPLLLFERIMLFAFISAAHLYNDYISDFPIAMPKIHYIEKSLIGCSFYDIFYEILTDLNEIMVIAWDVLTMITLSK